MIQRKALPTQAHYGKRPMKARFEDALNYGHKERRSGYMKPVGGMWTTTWETAYTEGWPSWCIGEDFHPDHLDVAYLLEPVECNVIELAGFDQCHEFMVRYGKQIIDLPRDRTMKRWFEEEGHDPDYVYTRAYEHFDDPSFACPQWEEVAKDADCVRLLTPYEFNVRLGPYLHFNGWDCESTVWLRWKFAGAAKRVPIQILQNRREEGAKHEYA